MTIYNKNGSLAVTIVQRLTTLTLRDKNNTISSQNVSTSPSSIVLDDEDEFVERNKWENVQKIVNILFNFSVAMAMILSVLGLVLLLTILDRKVREKSQMWYIYHLCFLTVFTGLIVHPLAHFGSIFEDTHTCYFVMYGVEYALFGVAMNIILVNMEIYFTKMLTLQRWEVNPFFRFLVLILSGWLIVCLIVAHVIINNNRPVNGRFCFHLKEKSIYDARFALRQFVPSAICFLFAIAFIVTYFLKRSRISFTTMSGELREIRTEGCNDETQWLKCVLFLNIVYVIRETSAMIIYFNSEVSGPDHYIWIIIIITVHAQALYMLPICLFFLADVRTTLKTFARTALVKVSFGRVRLGDDLENLSVSFANSSKTDNS